MDRKSHTHLDVPTRIEEENRIAQDGEPINAPQHDPHKVPKWQEPSDDEDSGDNRFSVTESWNLLFNLPTCQMMMVTDAVQKRLQMFVGVNVSQEFPWKQIRFKYLRDHLFDNIENGDLLRVAFQGYNPEHHVLIGYAPLLAQNEEELPEGDPFILFINPDDAKVALSVIRNIELYENWAMNKRLVKKPRPWVSLGSENEVNLLIPQFQVAPVDVEIQSVYPLTIPADKSFVFRKCADVRDGYVELLPSETAKFDNITKKRVTIALQSAPKCVELEQQTDPTFPTNAWSQYLYEINEGEDDLDESSQDEEDKEQQSSSKPATPVPEVQKSPPQVSDQIAFLLKTLEFNQIDMYRNDYPLISEKQVEHYTNPYLDETLCFANISKSNHRYVCGIDWYPSLSGLIVTSYTFSTPSTIDSVSHKADIVQRAVLEANPILMWSFNDNLNFKLEFESSLEVTSLSFCPHNANLLFGGAKNGQIIIWDLQDRTEKLYAEEILTAAQSRYRALVTDFLKWTILTNEDCIVPPATMTSLEASQKAAITGIYWMGERYYINTFGKIYTNPDLSMKHKFFMTCAIDGTIAFWDLDAVADKKSQGSSSKRDQAKALTQSESAYRNKVLKPVFQVAFAEPLTAIVCDTSVFRCKIVEPKKSRKNPLNYKIKLEANDPLEMRQSLITSSFYGRIERINWLGLYAEADGREHITTSINFARVHDGPVVAMKKNPFYPKIFASIGRNILAVWKEDYNYSPIFWRKRITDITAVAWSEDRPAVLFLTRIDGYFEAWDILARDDDACLNDILGGGVVTTISEHRPAEPEKLLGIGDYNSSFRMVKLPKTFYIPQPDELERVREYVWKEESRKKAIQDWEQNYFEHNRDIIEAKREAEIDARKEMERIEKENMINAARKFKEEADEKKSSQPLSQLNYTERMKRQWDELNLNRLMSILMSRKRMDAAKLERETALEKERLNYETAKKESFIQTLQRVGDEVATIRARILPAEKAGLRRADMILSSVSELMEDVSNYTEIETEANEILDSLSEFNEVDYTEFLKRGEHRRKILNKSLGGNTERLFWYEEHKRDRSLEECDWGYEQFVNADDEWRIKQPNKIPPSEGNNVISSDTTLENYEQ